MKPQENNTQLYSDLICFLSLSDQNLAQSSIEYLKKNSFMCFIQLSFCFQEEDWSGSVTQKWLEAEVSLYNLISFQAVYKKDFLTLIHIVYHYQFELAQIQYMKDVTLCFYLAFWLSSMR